jgi:aryl-alcohol dehydrogenase-like predicted oxidoreductase
MIYMEKRRLGKTGHMSSILIFGGFALFRISQKDADAAIETAWANGINHIDVSPLYGDAEQHLGSWFKRHGKQFWVACKTAERKKKGAWESLKRSLETLHVDKFDLFQLHGIDDPKTLATAMGPGGALEAILEAREQGLVDNIGITGHNPPNHYLALQKFDFDTVLFPLNRIHAAHPTDWNVYEPLLKIAKQKDVGVMAIKSVAKGMWPDGQAKEHAHKYGTWYEPFDDEENIRKSLYFTLSQDITAAVLPGELKLWPTMIEAAHKFKPLSKKDQQQYMDEVKKLKPLAGPRMD